MKRSWSPGGTEKPPAHQPHPGTAHRAWWRYLISCVVIASLYFAFEWNDLGRAAIYIGLNVAALIAVVAGVRRHNPPRRRGWVTLVVALVIYSIADVFWYAPNRPFPGPADFLFLSAYVLIAVSLSLMAADRAATGQDKGIVLDALIITSGAAAASYVFLIAPYLHASSLSLPARLVSVSYPTLDLLMLATATRMALSPGARPTSFWLLIAAVLGQLSSDTGYAIGSLNGTFDFASPIFVGWFMSYSFFGAAALHPSMVAVARRSDGAPQQGLTRARLALLLLVAAIPPALLATGAGSGGVLVGVTVLTVLLVTARVVSTYVGRLEASVAVIAILAVVMVVVSNHSTHERFKRIRPLEAATENIRANVATSHLWLEELIAGDEQIDINRQVLQPLEDAITNCNAMLVGGLSDVGMLMPMGGVEARANLQRLCAEIEQLRARSTERMAAGKVARAGSALDRAYDSSFENVNRFISRDEAYTDAMIESDLRRGRQLDSAVAALLLVLLCLVAYLVTRHRRAIEAKNAELAANEKRLFQFMEHLPVGVFVLDARGNPIFANKLSNRLLGRGINPNAPAEDLAEVYEAYVAGTDRPYPTQSMPIVKALSGTASDIDDIEVRTPRGAIRLHVWGSPIYNGDNTVQYALAAFTDISEAKKAEENLRKKSALIRLLSDVAVAANEAASVEDALSTALKRVCAVTGWPVGHVYLESPEGLVPLDVWHADRPQQIEAFRKDTQSRRLPPGEGVVGSVFVSGKPEWITDITRDPDFTRAASAVASNLRSAIVFPLVVGAESVGVMEFYSREPAEPDEDFLEVMTTIGAQLGRVIERKGAQDALAQQRNELARSNADLEQFAYVASHDLQEPLRMVSSYVQLLGRRYKGKLDEDADEFIAYAVDGAARMQNLIQALLSFSRVGRRGTAAEPVAIADTIAAATRNLEMAIEESGASVVYNGLPTVRGDAAQLTQLFQNLIGNAIKFRGDAPLCVTVEASRQGEQWLFVVADNGIGLEPQYADRIFTIFQRLHTKEEYPGTGIGLSICKKIVEHHRGKIWVESQPGQGSRFLFTLPSVKGESS